MRRRQFSIVSRCALCASEEESRNHLLYTCRETKKVWLIVSNWFGHLATPKNIEDAIAARKKHSPLIKQLWQACVISSIVQIWKARNKNFMRSRI
ncbi:hypothetical protein FRX31_005422 [Thalictrum thalictroides]|uniref:Reverse transcriptase zinc-binding domain-containing protein n=1 Tax=Thalictrum thalictroides TaxID=46969 RepID=A0A7J6X5G7_THATH|nr:hypothetical protein FRX31_005422 [Thalictrum thalictroides]